MLDPIIETFVQEFQTHGNRSEAFRVAKPHSKKWKPETVHKRASEFLKRGDVQGRLQELQKMSAEKHEITIEKLTEMTMSAYEMAMKDEVKAPSAAVKAVDFIANLHGLMVKKTELTGKDGQTLVPVLNVTVSGDKS